ncbi:MAG: CRISPR-associated endonuclease Cas1 [Candidatus Hatepunaea meridiana]|nr:CRISPR-associated endonuclease Cas1 [Candidatus Hatepunaea meridiana]
MATLYLTEQGSELHKRGESLIVEKDDVELLEVELHRIDSVLIFGNVQFTTQAVVELLKNNIEMSFLSMSGNLRGQLIPPFAKNVILRNQQHNQASNNKFVIKQAREIVRVKIANSLEVLKQADWRRDDDAFIEARNRLKKAVKNVKNTTSIDELNGIEGSAARAYFDAFALLLKKGSNLFKGRSRRPPGDPVNALLSFGYTLLGSRLQSILNAHGFDPFVGWMHQLDYGRPSLALDLLEPYRAPYIDRWVVKMFNLSVFKIDDFIPQNDGGQRLTQKALKRFFKEWEKHLANEEVFKIMRCQVESAARVIMGKQDFPDHPKFKAH